MNILIINAYSVRNSGDAAIVSCIVRHLRSTIPDCRVQVMSSFEEENLAFCRRLGAESVPAIWRIEPGCSYLRQYLRGLLLFCLALMRLAPARLVAESDLVVSLGGGYLYSSARGPLGLSLVNCLFHIWLAVWMGKPTLLFPQSIGPMLWRTDRWLLRCVLHTVQEVFTREPISTDYIESLGLPSPTQCPDMAFALEPADAPRLEATKRGRGPWIGVTVLDWKFAIRGATADHVEAYLVRLQTAFESVHHKYPDSHIFVFPQVCVTSSLSANDDRPISQRLVDKIASFATLVPTSDLAGPEELAGLYAQMDAFVGSRMHSAIFAMCAGVPTIGLAYQPKTTGTWQLLGLGDWVFDIDRFGSADVESLLLTFLSNQREYSLLVRRTVAEARAEITRLIDDPLAAWAPEAQVPQYSDVATSAARV